MDGLDPWSRDSTAVFRVPRARFRIHTAYSLPAEGQFQAFPPPYLGTESTYPQPFFEHSSYEQASFEREKRTSDLLATRKE